MPSNDKRIPRLTDFEIYKSLEDKKGLSYLEYCKYMFAFNLYTMNYLIYTGNTLYLPFLLGSLQVVKRKAAFNKRRIDFDYYRKTGMKKFHSNMHSEGYYARMLWIKRRNRYRNPLLKYLFSFTLNRAIKKDLSHAVMHKNTIYKYKLANH